MRIIGMDIHRVAAEVVSLQDGQIRRLGRVPMLREALEAFAQKQLSHDDHVVIEATGNAAALVDVISPHDDRVIVANPKQVWLIAHAKVKTDAIDAAVLAKLYATGFLPEVWSPDQKTLALRRQVARRTQFVRQRVWLKNLIQSILHAHLVRRAHMATSSASVAGAGWRSRSCQTMSGLPSIGISPRSSRSKLH
jgi:transposase